MNVKTLKQENKNLAVENKTLKSENTKLEKSLVQINEFEEIQKVLTQIQENKNKIEENKKTIDKNNKSIEKIQEEEKTLKAIKGLSMKEIEEKIKSKEISIPKKRITELRKKESRKNFEELKGVEIISTLKGNQNGSAIERGYLFKVDNIIYCTALNHIAFKVEQVEDKLRFTFNNNHEKFYNTLCTCIMQEGLYYLLESLNLKQIYTLKENTSGLKVFEESFKNKILIDLTFNDIDIQNNILTNRVFEEITINKTIDAKIKELQY